MAVRLDLWIRLGQQSKQCYSFGLFLLHFYKHIGLFWGERLKWYFSKIPLSDHDWWLNRYCSIFRESWTQSCPPAQPHNTTPPKPAHLPAPKLFKSIWHTAFGFEHFSNAVARALYFKNDFDLFFGVGECIALYFLNYTHDSQVGAFLHERTIRGALNIFTLCLLLLSTQLQSAHCSAQYLLILTSLCFFFRRPRSWDLQGHNLGF